MTDETSKARPPAAIERATYAIYVQAVLTLLSGALGWGYSAYYKSQLIKSNNKLKTGNKSKHVPYTASEISHDLHSLRISSTLTALIFAVVMIYAARKLSTRRGIWRWAYVIVSLLTLAPVHVVDLWANEPGPLKVTSGLTAIASIIALALLLFAPSATKFFLPVRGSRSGGAGAARPGGFGGLGGMFAPRPPRNSPGGPAGRSPIFGGSTRQTPSGSGSAGSGSGAGAGSGAGSGRRPAATRPATERLVQPAPGNQARTKSKSRTSAADAARAAESAAPEPRRGKSRNT